MYTEEQKESIFKSVIVDIADIADERALHANISSVGEKPYSYGWFMYDEFMNDYMPYTKYDTLKEDVQKGLTFTEQQLLLIQQLGLAYISYDDQMREEIDLQDENQDIYALKDPKWHLVQEQARKVLEVFPETPQILAEYPSWKNGIPRIRILEQHLDDPEYVQEQLKLFIDVVKEIPDKKHQEEVWPIIEKSWYKGGILDLYYRFSVKAEVILKHSDRFSLEPKIIASLQELLKAMDKYYHYLVVAWRDPIHYILEHYPWHNIRAQAAELLMDWKPHAK